MKNVFKWIGIVLGSLIGLLLVAGLVLFLIGNGRLKKNMIFSLRISPFPRTRRVSNMENIALKHCVRVVMAWI